MVVASTVITVLSSSLQLWYEYDYEKQEIEKRIIQVGKSFSKVVARSVWNLDEKSLEGHLNSILMYPEVRFAEVLADMNKVTTSVVRPDKNSYSRILSFDVMNPNNSRQKLGVLNIYLGYNELDKSFKAKGFFILIRQFFDIFIFSISILLIFELLVTRHLRVMADYTRQLDAEDLDKPLIMPRKRSRSFDELDRVAAAINTMRGNMLSYMRRRQEVEASILDSESRFQRITAGANDGLWEFRIDGTYTFFSDQYKRMLHWEDVPNDGLLDFWEKNLHPADKQRVLRALNRHIEHDESFDVEYRILTGTGEYKWVKAKGKADRDKLGNAKFMSGSISDITDLKRANEEILSAKNEIESYSKQLELVNQMASELGEAKTMAEILGISHRYLSLSLNDDLLSIFLHDAKTDMFQTYTHKQDGTVQEDLRYYPLESSMVGVTLTEAKIRFIPNFDKINSVDLLPIHKKGMKSGVSIPLIGSKECIGVLQIASRHYNAFTSYDTRILKQIGSLIGINIERKSYEEQLVDREFQLKSVFESTTNIIFSVDTQFCYLSFNNKYAEVFNTFYNKDIQVGDDLNLLLADDEEDREKLFRNIGQALSGERLYCIDRYGNDEIGHFYFESFYNPIYNEKGQVTGASVFSNDITEKRLAEEELLKTQSRLEEAQRIAHIGNFEWDVLNDQIWWSNEVYSIFGIAPSGNMQDIEYLFEKVHPDDIQSFQKVIQQKQVRFRMEWRIQKRKDLGYVMIIGTNEYNEQGEHLTCQATVQEISEQKVQEKNKIDKEIAEQKSKHKDEFLANMSHEIRSPLNAIVGFSQILMRQSQRMELPFDFKENLEHIKLSGQNLSELINNILDLSKIEAGKITYSFEDLNFKQLFQGIYHINKGKAAEKDLIFQYNFSDKIPKSIVSDRTKLNQVLMNLVSNAIKFTPNGKKVTLSASCVDEQIIVEVADEGIGIQEDRLPYIFDAFEQADNSITRHFGGTGLGLAISKRLIESMNGRIELESEAGRGSTFKVSFPLKEGTDMKLNEEIEDPARIKFKKDVRILVVEDNKINQELMTSYFREMGLNFDIAENGKAGVDKVVATKPHMVLMDMHMPVLDGMAATRIIREHEDPEVNQIPIVALSADAFTQQQKKVLEMGVNEYLTKPIDFSKLLAVLVKYLETEENEDSIELIARKEMDDEVRHYLQRKVDDLLQIPIYMTDQLLEAYQEMNSSLSFYNHPFQSQFDELKNAIYSGEEEELTRILKGINDVKNTDS